MNAYAKAGFLLVLAVGCGSSEEEAKEALDDNKITLTPAPGTFAYRPWVIFTKEDDGAGSGVVYAKAPGNDGFEIASCLGSPYDSSTASYCAEVQQTGTLSYYLFNTAAQGKELSADYTIELATNNLTADLFATKDATAESVELTEKETFCDYGLDGELTVIVQTTNEAKLTADRYAYFGFRLVSPEEGAIVKFTKENDNEAGLDIKPTSDDVPSFILSPTYSTNTGTPDVGVTYPDATCEIVVEAYTRGGVVKGTATCSNLRSWKFLPEAADEPLGKLVNVSGAWQCDSYR